MTNRGDAPGILSHRYAVAARDDAGESWPLRYLFNCGNYPISLIEPAQTKPLEIADLDQRPPGRYELVLSISLLESTRHVLATVTIVQTRPPIAVKPLLSMLDQADKHACFDVVEPIARFFTIEATSAEVQRVGRHLADRNIRLWHSFVKGTLQRATWWTEWTHHMNRLEDERRMVLADLLLRQLKMAEADVRSIWLEQKRAVIKDLAGAKLKAGVIENLNMSRQGTHQPCTAINARIASLLKRQPRTRTVQTHVEALVIDRSPEDAIETWGDRDSEVLGD